MSRNRHRESLPIDPDRTKVSAAAIIDRIREKWPDFDGRAINCPVHGRVELAKRANFARTLHMNCPKCELDRCKPPSPDELRNKLRRVHPNVDWPEPSWAVNQGRNRKVMAHCTIHGVAWEATLQFHKNGAQGCPLCFPRTGRPVVLFRSAYYPQKGVPAHVDLKEPQ